ncbi:uncharacterized protein C9orf152-like [Pelodytes ibericus]
MATCCGCWDKCSVWKPAVKVYRYVSEILSGTHTDAATRKAIMEINLLEEKYFSIKQKQKKQSHVIVYKAGENKRMLGEMLINTVPVNKTIERQPKAFKAKIPVRDVTLDVPSKGYLNDGNDQWHTHINMHRMVQVDNHFALQNGSWENDQKMNNENKSLPLNRGLSYEKPSMERGRPQRKSSNSSGDNIPVTDLYRNASFKHTIPATWPSYPLPSSKSTSPTDKAFTYPFPQKKDPRISETARKLGLYCTH